MTAWLIILALALAAALVAIGWLWSGRRAAQADTEARRLELQQAEVVRAQLEQDLAQAHSDAERARVQASVAAEAAAAEARREADRDRLEEASDAEPLLKGIASLSCWLLVLLLQVGPVRADTAATDPQAAAAALGVDPPEPQSAQAPSPAGVPAWATVPASCSVKGEVRSGYLVHRTTYERLVAGGLEALDCRGKLGACRGELVAQAGKVEIVRVPTPAPEPASQPQGSPWASRLAWGLGGLAVGVVSGFLLAWQ